MPPSKKIFTTFDAARIFNVDITTVINWVDSGKLPAYKTPGGHRRITRDDLADFAARYGLPMEKPLLKSMDKSASGQKSFCPKKLKVLIVEDDASVAGFISKVVRGTFTGKGYDVLFEVATDGFQGGEKLSSFKPDIVVLDIRLPGVDGFEVLRWIKKNYRRKVRVIAVTAFPSKEIKEKIIRSGADDFLAKPFGVETLKEKLLALYS